MTVKEFAKLRHPDRKASVVSGWACDGVILVRLDARNEVVDARAFTAAPATFRRGLLDFLKHTRLLAPLAERKTWRRPYKNRRDPGQVVLDVVSAKGRRLKGAYSLVLSGRYAPIVDAAAGIRATNYGPAPAVPVAFLDAKGKPFAYVCPTNWPALEPGEEPSGEVMDRIRKAG